MAITTDYPSFLAVAEGRMDPSVFANDHLEVVDGAQHLPAFLGWMGAAIQLQVA